MIFLFQFIPLIANCYLISVLFYSIFLDIITTPPINTTIDTTSILLKQTMPTIASKSPCNSTPEMSVPDSTDNILKTTIQEAAPILR